MSTAHAHGQWSSYERNPYLDIKMLRGIHETTEQKHLSCTNLHEVMAP